MIPETSLGSRMPNWDLNDEQKLFGNEGKLRVGKCVLEPKTAYDNVRSLRYRSRYLENTILLHGCRPVCVRGQGKEEGFGGKKFKKARSASLSEVLHHEHSFKPYKGAWIYPKIV